MEVRVEETVKDPVECKPIVSKADNRRGRPTGEGMWWPACGGYGVCGACVVFNWAWEIARPDHNDLCQVRALIKLH
jgi:hypothetical protein